MVAPADDDTHQLVGQFEYEARNGVLAVGVASRTRMVSPCTFMLTGLVTTLSCIVSLEMTA